MTIQHASVCLGSNILKSTYGKWLLEDQMVNMID